MRVSHISELAMISVRDVAQIAAGAMAEDTELVIGGSLLPRSHAGSLEALCVLDSRRLRCTEDTGLAKYSPNIFPLNTF